MTGRRMTRVLLGLGLLLGAPAILTGCATVDATGRNQLMLISEEQEQSLGLQAYQEVLATSTVRNDGPMNTVLQRVGGRIARAANRPDFNWEFKLIESEQVNAFCLPGGKIAVYTGILPIMKNEAGMAAVMGHEVAHALARHGGERISQALAVNAIGKLLEEGLAGSSARTRELTMGAFGLGSQYGVLLPYSRTQELEADEIGLMLMARAGYDPREAVDLWKRMEDAGAGETPEFLSTHPVPKKRIEQIEELLPKAMQLYRASVQQYGLGQNW